MQSRWWFYPVALVAALGLILALLLGFAAVLAYPTLPSLEALTDYQPKIPLRVYSADGALLAEFGEERRALVRMDHVPKAMRDAILAAEDERFYRHHGVDYMGVARAALANLTSGGAREGASTITMQVARNFFLSREKTITRKFSEVLLSMKIEASLTKDQILELYINQIYLGQRAYGFAAAAQTYFGKPLDRLSVAETAMLAGLPKAPSRFNPAVNPQRARERQHYVLRRMRDLGYITQPQYDAALKEPLHVQREQTYEANADYLAEMVRQALYESYKDDIYTKGYTVYTTLRKNDQQAAFEAVRQGVLDYDKRHGYRGPEGRVELPKDDTDIEGPLEDSLAEMGDVNGLTPAVVLHATPKAVKAYAKGGEKIEIVGDGLKFAQKALAEDAKARIARGSLIRVQKDDKGHWQILQLPQVEAALVSMEPKTGAVRALVGGFDYNRNKFNHVTQAWRQPGSSFKPFIYSAALEKGFTPATVINDAPLVVDPAETGGQQWEPQNFDGEFAGPIRLRTALTKSKNLVSIRILQAIGPQYAQEYIQRFGFSPEQHPAYLTMALGAGSATPMQMATGYSVFANGGYRVKPYFIDRVVLKDKVIAQATPEAAGANAERAIDARNAFVMNSLMRDVVKYGTAAKAMQLKRNDLAGKTGTTNDQVDAWFAGFHPNLVAVSWIGFDKPRSLGGSETGAQAALPMWINYMGKALRGEPESEPTPPEGVVYARVSPTTGLRVPDSQEGMPEVFYQEFVPAEQGAPAEGSVAGGAKRVDEAKSQLF